MLMTLRQRPRPLKGRCGACAFKAVCGGNTRIRALQLTGDPWEEDPHAIWRTARSDWHRKAPRLMTTAFRGKSMIRRIAFFSMLVLQAAPALPP